MTIYTFTTQKTIDELMDAGFADKLDSAQLGLDGALVEQQVEEVSAAEVLEKAVRNFNPAAATVDEADMEREWEESLRHRLAAAETAYRLHQRRRRAATAQLTVVKPPSPLALALAARRKAARTEGRVILRRMGAQNDCA